MASDHRQQDADGNWWVREETYLRLVDEVVCLEDKVLQLHDEVAQTSKNAFQAEVGDWLPRCFESTFYNNMVERGDRAAEEFFEMLQAHHYPRERLATLIDYVYGRPVGEPAQEIGGVMVTLAAFCHIAGQNMAQCGERELERINRPEIIAKIREKQAAKRLLHLDNPLPGNPDAAELFYMQDSRQTVGNDMLWWREGGQGYTTDLREAAAFSKPDALRMHQSRESDIPWPKSYIDARTRPAVDHQYCKRDEALEGTGVLLIKPQRVHKEGGKCDHCGGFINERQRFEGCPKCGGENRP
jgi:hypothetical protein